MSSNTIKLRTRIVAREYEGHIKSKYWERSRTCVSTLVQHPFRNHKTNWIIVDYKNTQASWKFVHRAYIFMIIMCLHHVVACRWGHFHEASCVNIWLHHRTVVAAIVVHGLVITSVEVDAEHVPWLASHLNPQLPHSVPILSPHQLGRTQQWGECNIINHNPQCLEMALRITAYCHGLGCSFSIERILNSFDPCIESATPN
jgi:hypothetical protein